VSGRVRGHRRGQDSVDAAKQGGHVGGQPALGLACLPLLPLCAGGGEVQAVPHPWQVVGAGVRVEADGPVSGQPFAGEDHAEHFGGLLESRLRDGHELVAGRLKAEGGFPQRPLRCWRQREAGEGLEDADPQPAALVSRPAGAGTQDAVEQPQVCHRPRHRPDMVQGAGQREDPLAGDGPVGRLQAADPAQRCRYAHRPGGVGAERERREPGSEGRRGAAARPAGNSFLVPGVAGHPVRG